MGKPPWRKSAVVLDIDNTLFDWVHFWQEAFGALVESVLSSAPGLDRATLLGEIRTIHRRVGTSEYAFVLQDLRPVLSPYGFDADAELRAVTAYREARTATLELYPDVDETLRTIKSRGSLILGFTESTGFHTASRLAKFGLDGVFDAVFSPPDYAIPEGVDLSAVRTRPASSYQLQRTRHEIVPGGFKKPDPTLLESILQREHAKAADAVYVGDSLGRDIAMAQSAGVLDAFAEYGRPAPGTTTDLLVAVTHWADDEFTPSAGLAVVPSIVLRHSIREILEHIEFERFGAHGRE